VKRNRPRFRCCAAAFAVLLILLQVILPLEHAVWGHHHAEQVAFASQAQAPVLEAGEPPEGDCPICLLIQATGQAREPDPVPTVRAAMLVPIGFVQAPISRERSRPDVRGPSPRGPPGTVIRLPDPAVAA
jgi:hypothetical protein